MSTRYGTAIALGAAVTFGLLWLMQLMIATGHRGLSPERAFPDIAFVRVERAPPAVIEDPPPERPPESQPKPETPGRDDGGDFEDGIAVSYDTPALDTGVTIDGPRIGASDGDYLPIVMVKPVYPSRAIARELEGHVVVEFTVTELGTTRDVVVVESSDSAFDAAAVESASKYKYRPRVVNGEPVEVPGVQALIRFELSD